MIKEPVVRLFDLSACLSDAMDLVAPALVNHHKRVAYIAHSIADELDLPKEEQNNLLLTGLLHDSGALSLKEKLDILQFESKFAPGDHCKHPYRGYLLLKKFEPFSTGAQFVRYHHLYWNEGRGSEADGTKVPMGSHILHLADRVEVLINREKEILGQVRSICRRVEEHSGTMFVPELVDIFKNLATKEYFWLNIVFPSINLILERRLRSEAFELDPEGLLSLAKIFSHIIDFRSRFTATHSSGVAASAEALARLMGFSERECRMMCIAGYLHDLGKLAIPAEILEKPAQLTKDDFSIIKSHTFYTFRILERISDLYIINTWAAFHHERLDGSGYPFHHKGEDLSLGSRIMAVADVFVGMTEDRPYRKGMKSDGTLQLLQDMADKGFLDAKVVAQLRLNYDEVYSTRATTQAAATKEYEEFAKQTG